MHSNPPNYGHQDTTYQAIGGHEGIIDLVNAFYHAMDSLPQAKTIRDMHPQNLDLAKDKLVHFLSGWMGGPRIYGDKFGSISIPMAHQHIKINHQDKDAWLYCMQHALHTLGYPKSLQDYLLEQLAFPANKIVSVSQDFHARKP